MYNLAFYKEKNEREWDDFVLNKSINGTFLQTRRFINYHETGKFIDKSICIRKNDELVAVVLGCELNEGNKRIYYSHKGTSFGGIIVSLNIYKVEPISNLIEEVESFLKDEKFDQVFFRMAPEFYNMHETKLIDYFMYYYGYDELSELNFYINIPETSDGILNSFSSSKRRDCKYSFKNDLKFDEITDIRSLKQYYDIYMKNLNKLDLKPVHSLNDLIDLKFNRFSDNIKIFGVYKDEVLIAGTVMFIIRDGIYHTQYLSSDENYLNYYPMDFLIYSLINMLVNKKANILSFGICTENQGKYLNYGLSKFKEGFGCVHSINKTFKKEIRNV